MFDSAVILGLFILLVRGLTGRPFPNEVIHFTWTISVVAESTFRLCSVLFLFFVNVVNLIGQGWRRTPK